MSTTHSFIIRDNDLSIYIDGIPHTIDRKDPRFAGLVANIKEKANRDSVITRALDNTRPAKKFVKTSKFFSFVGNTVLYRGEPVSQMLANHIIRMADEGEDAAPMAAFLDRVALNPSYRVHQHLFQFLEYGKCPITPDGHFLVYKKVNKRAPTAAFPLDPEMKKRGYNFNLVDVHSGTVSNAIGSFPSMLRHKVNEDPEQTCSSGLHVCSHSYLSQFSGDVVITCKVDPADVVAIPRDYSNTKMRVCKYEVMGLLANEKVAKNVLTNKTVKTGREDVCATPKKLAQQSKATKAKAGNTRWAVEVTYNTGITKTYDCMTRGEARGERDLALRQANGTRNGVRSAKIVDRNA